MSLFDNSSANESPIPQNHKWFKTGIDWFRDGDTYEANDPFYSYYITSAAYRDDVEKKPLKYKKYDVLKGSLQTFNTIGFLSNGNYYFIQPNNKIATSGLIKIYNYLGTDNEVASGGDIADENVNLTIDQSTNYILAGSTITFDPVLKSVSCDFINGESTFFVPDDADLTTGFTAGLLQGDADEEGSMFINFAATHKEVFNRNQLNFPSSSYDLVNAGHKTTAQLQIKIGTGADTRYLRQGAGSLEWGTDTTVHTMTLVRGKSANGSGTILNNAESDYVDISTIRNQDDFGDNLSLSSAEFRPCRIERVGNIYTAETAIKFGGSFPIPLVSGEVVITLTATNEYTPYYYQYPSNPSWAVNSGGTTYQNQTPSTVTRTTKSGSFYGIDTGSITVTGYNAVALNENQVGLTFTTNQSNNDAFENLDLGEIEVGQTTSGLANAQNAIFSVQHNTGTDADPVMFTSTQGFRANDTGDYLNILQLLTREFLQLQTEPLEILQADVFSSDISPIKNLKYSINDDGVFKYYQFLGGTFKAQSETMSGEWFKISTSASVSVGSPDTINAGRAMSPSSLGVLNSGENINSKIILNQINENSLGTTNAAIQSGTATTQITLLNNTRAKIYNGQKIQITYADGSNSLTLTASSDVATNSKQIPVTSFTPELDYPLGCIVSPLVYDLTNVITGGGGSTSPGGSDTQVQFNDGGSFGGDSGLTYNKTTDTLTAVNLAVQDIDVTGSSNALTVNCDDGNVGIYVISTDRVASIRFEDIDTNDVILAGADGDDFFIRTDDGGFKVKTQENIVTALDLDSSGNLSIAGNILPNITSIKILPRDFIADDSGRPLMIDDSSTKRYLKSFNTSRMYASIDIPKGFKATHINIYGNDTSAITIYEAAINDNAVTSKGTGNVGTQINITDVDSAAQNYLLIELQQSSTSKVYGGVVAIAKI